MTSRSTVNKKKKIFNWWQLLLIVILFLVILVIFFPQKLFIQSLLTSKTTQVTLNYLRILVKQNPNNLDYRIKLIKEEILIGNLKDAKQLVMPFVQIAPKTKEQMELLRLYYQIVRIELYQLPPKDPKRLQKELLLKNLISTLETSPLLTTKQRAQMADSALADQMPKEALRLYKSVMEKNENQSIDFYVRGAQAALYEKQYEDSAIFYLMAMAHSQKLEDKRGFYFKAINALGAGGDAEKTWQFAEKYIDGLVNDKATNLYLVNLALSSQHQKGAEQYMSKLLQLNFLDLE